MELVRWNPWNEMTSFRNSLYRMFDDRSFPSWEPRKKDKDPFNGNWNPAVDVYETDQAYVVNAELPGMNKDDITIDVKDRTLTMKGERRYDNEVKDEHYYRRERAFGSFQRSFSLPEGVESEKITAEFKNGMLKVTIPRPEAKKPKQITVH